MWHTIRTSLQETLTESEYALWIKPLACRQADEHCLELSAPDRFFCAWVEDRYLPLIRSKASELDSSMTVRLGVSTQPPLPLPECGKNGQLRLPGISAEPMQRLRSLHPAFTFEQFMVGQSNLLARSACQALAQGDRTFGNCLFINSATGLGKSHLTQAVVHQILRTAPSTQLQYLSAQQFSADMVKEIRNKSMEQFSKKYISHCDILLMEDIHVLKGKTKTQEELNIILDYMVKSGRRVILTSALAPGSLEGIDEDFRSRMSSGLVTGIDLPDYETRARIIRHKFSAHGLAINENLIGYMAENLQGDIRRMESAVIGIKAQSCMYKTQPDLHIAQKVLGELLGGQAAESLNAETIRAFVGRQFNVSEEELCSRSRKRSITFPRQVGMYLTRKYTKNSLAEIGSFYKRDHSTVQYAIKTITQGISRETSVREQIDLLCNGLKKC